jgi:RNA polymerase sigma-70 factor (ECF subfamily)
MIGADEKCGPSEDLADAAPPDARDHAAASAASPDRWVEEHGDALWRFCLSRTRSAQAAEEIVQETLLAALEGLERFEGASSERTWLLGIATHKVADYFRRARKDDLTGMGTGTPETPESPAGRDTFGDMFTRKGFWARLPDRLQFSGESEAERASQLAALRKCLESLPPGQNEVVWMRDLLDVPGESVCKVLGLTPTNLWTRLHRARSALRLCMERGRRKKEGA